MKSEVNFKLLKNTQNVPLKKYQSVVAINVLHILKKGQNFKNTLWIKEQNSPLSKEDLFLIIWLVKAWKMPSCTGFY